jgi:hypothetical protein
VQVPVVVVTNLVDSPAGAAALAIALALAAWALAAALERLDRWRTARRRTRRRA